MNRILAVTGATGKKSGGGIVDVLSNHKSEVLDRFPGGVRCLTRKTSDISILENSPLLFDIRSGDFKDKQYLISALENVDTLLHIAGIHNSRIIVDAAVESNVKRMICVHTTGIYSKYKEAGEEYRQTDAYVENMCRKNNIALTILRPTMIYGNIYDNNVIQFIKMVDRFPIMPVVNGANYELQPVHYMDLSLAYYDVLMNEQTANHNYILSGGEPILLRDMLTEIGKNLGKSVNFISCPFPIAYIGACILYVCSLRKKDYREKVQRLCEPRVYSHEEATRDFGYSPRNFEVGIVEEVQQYRKCC